MEKRRNGMKEKRSGSEEIMQITELFVSELEKNICKYPHGELDGFLPDAHASLPELQENLLYICASGRRSLARNCEYSFSNVRGYLLLYSIKGQGMIEVTGDSCNLAAGNLLLWDCEDFIRLKSTTTEWEVDMLYIDGAALDTFYEELCKVDFPVFPVPEGAFAHCLILELMSLGTEITPHHAILAHKLLTSLLSDLLLGIYISRSAKRATPAYILEICQLFNTSCQTDYSMEELAQRYHVNRYRLTREFSQFVGMPPVKYLNNVRIEHARTLLETTNMPIGAVGAAVGIHNSTHFINMYKLKTGMTPLIYRAKYRAFKQIRK